jgi:hypothetical protein
VGCRMLTARAAGRTTPTGTPAPGRRASDCKRAPPGCTDLHPVHAVQDRTEPRALPARQEVHLHFHGVTAEDVAEIIKRERSE